MGTFKNSTWMNKVNKVVAPIADIKDYSVIITTNNFTIGKDNCFAVDVDIHYHINNKCESVYNVNFTSWSDDNNKKYNDLKSFVLENFIKNKNN